MADARPITLVGAGRMGLALLEGWRRAKLISKRHPCLVVEPRPGAALAALVRAGQARLGAFEASPSPRQIVLAVKPQVLPDVLAAMREAMRKDDLVLSIVAGRTIASIAAGLALKEVRIVRAMPNTPAAIGKGATAAFTPARGKAAAEARALAGPLLEAVGALAWLGSEDEIDAVTAVSGSGPAYVFALIEALAAAGVAEGLAPETAKALARATVVGAGALLDADPSSPEALRAAVTSPGGTTEAGLKVLLGARGLDRLMRQTVAAARARAIALGKG